MEDAAAATLRNLEWRLQRLDHYLTSASGEGHRSEALPGGTKDIIARLGTLKKGTEELFDGSETTARLAQLYADLPELVNGTELSADTLSTRLPIVVSSAPMFSDAVSKLTTLQQYPLSDPNELIQLLNRRPRLASFDIAQAQHAEQIEDLKRRSAAAIYQWQTQHVLGSNEAWASTEQRLMAIEQAVRRREAAKAREENDE